MSDYFVNDIDGSTWVVLRRSDRAEMGTYPNLLQAEMAARSGNFAITAQEAGLMNKKETFAAEYCAKVKELLETFDKLDALKNEFLALDYATVMTDADVASLGIVVTDLYAAAGVIDALKVGA